MKKPRSGWPKYKKARKQNPEELHYGKLASVFIIWGIIGLLTSWYFNNFIDKKTYNVNPAASYRLAPGVLEDMSQDPSNLVGPIRTQRRGEVYEIVLRANLPVQSWSFIEGEVLDSDKEYLYSFGKELWHETGRDSDGPWRENKNTYSMKVTFPSPGLYYLNFKTESNRSPSSLAVSVTKKRGSALPHFWFGIIALVIGVILNEIRNRTIIKVLDEM